MPQDASLYSCVSWLCYEACLKIPSDEHACASAWLAIEESKGVEELEVEWRSWRWSGVVEELEVQWRSGGVGGGVEEWRSWRWSGGVEEFEVEWRSGGVGGGV